MTTSQKIVYCIIFVASTGLVGQAYKNPISVKIDAAIRLPVPPYFLILFYGNSAMDIPTGWDTMHNYQEFLVLDRSAYGIPRDMKLTAAYVDGNGTHFDIHAFGEKYRAIVSSNLGLPYKTMDYDPEFKNVLYGAPDAAVKWKDMVIFFQGCTMAVRNGPNDWEKPKDVQQFGLPCDPDAAWEYGETLFFLKGDQLWKWSEEGSVDGPYLFKETYDVSTWIPSHK